MSEHLRSRHDRLLREQAAQMFEKGRGYRLTARKLGVSAATVREWQKMYHVIGKGGLLTMGVKQARYDYETKVAAAKAVVDGGMSKPEAMVRFGIASATPLKQWCRLYRQGGAQALKPKPKGTHWLTPSSQLECSYVPRSRKSFREPPTGVVTGRWLCVCALRKGCALPIRRS